MKILVTGGAGFIGAHLVNSLINEGGHQVCNVDKLTYASRVENLAPVIKNENHIFYRVDITNTLTMMKIFNNFQPDAVMHLAAESHVDRSIGNSEAFIKTNILGSYHLLEATYEYWKGLSNDRQENFRFINVSTDEVYGSLGINDKRFNEQSPYRPNSPYSASKASFDFILRAYHHTYGFPAITTNCTNNFGTLQYPEKLIPVCILNAIRGRDIPVYGNGKQIRDWLAVEDHVSALITVLQKGVPGESYCIGGDNELTNIELIYKICDILDKLYPSKEHKKLIKHTEDRLGHDTRYAIDNNKIKNNLGWQPKVNFEKALYLTVVWYTQNAEFFRKNEK